MATTLGERLFPSESADSLSTVLFRVDTTLLAFIKSPVEVGNYGAAYRFLDATLFVGWSAGAAVYPVLARLLPDSHPR